MIRKKQDLKPSTPMIIDLNGPDGNAFALQLKLDGEKIADEMTSGDYENLIEVFDKHFGAFVILEQ